MPDILFSGGLNQQGPFRIDPSECSEGRNFRLEQNSLELRPREPQDLLSTTPNTAEVTGLLQLIKRDDTQTQLIAAGTSVYNWDMATAPNDSSDVVGTITADSRLRGTYWSLDDFAIVTDLDQNNVVKKWDGTTWADLVHNIPAVTSFYSRYSAVHQGRVVHANIKTDSTALPHVLLFSDFEDAENYDQSSTKQGAAQAPGNTSLTGDEAFWLVTPDLRPVNALLEFFDTLVVSTTGGKMFRLTGYDAKTFNFEEFYPRSAALGDEAVATIGTDIIYMKEGGAIELLSATERFGDVSVDDLSRFILDITKTISDAQIIYDQTEQQVLFFVDGRVLVMDKARLVGNLSPWSIYDTAMANNFNTKAAAYLRHTDKTWRTLWGDDSGNVYNFHGSGLSGDGGAEDIFTYRVSPRIEALDTMNQPLYGSFEYKRLGEVTVNASMDWTESYAVSRSSIPLKGEFSTGTAVVYGGAFYYGESWYYGQGSIQANPISIKGFSPVGRGPSFTLRLDVNSCSDFRINRITFE